MIRFLNRIPFHLNEKTGSNVFERFFEQKLDNFFEAFIKYLTQKDHLKKAVCDCFGNYVVQTMIKSYSKDERIQVIYDTLKNMTTELMEDDIGRKFLSNTAEFTGIPGVGNPRKNVGHQQPNKNQGSKGSQQNQRPRKGPIQSHQQANFNEKSFASSSRRHNGGQGYHQDSHRPDYNERQGKRPRGGAHSGQNHATGPRSHQETGYPQKYQQGYQDQYYGGYHQGYYHAAPAYSPYPQYGMHHPHSSAHHPPTYGGYDSMQARQGPYPGYEMNLNVNVHLNYDGTPVYSQRMAPSSGIHITQNQQTQTLQQQKGGTNNVVVRSGSQSPYGPNFAAGSAIIERNEFQSQTQETLKLADGQSFYLQQQQHHAHIGVSLSQNQSGNTSPTLPVSGSHLHPRSHGNSATKPPKSGSKPQQIQPQVASHQNLSEHFEK